MEVFLKFPFINNPEDENCKPETELCYRNDFTEDDPPTVELHNLDY